MSDERRSPVGLIAGAGRLPVLVARGMRDAGLDVCCVGLGQAWDDELPALCTHFRAAGVFRIGRWIRLLRAWRVDRAVMVGRVEKARMHDPFRLFRQIPDWRAVQLWYRRLRHDRRNAALLAAVADELERSGVRLVDSTMYIPDHLATEGVLTTVAPGAMQRADIAFGWPLLRQIVELDVGQSIAVRERDTIAVEAVEGTDRMIERAGTLCRAKGWTLLKTAKADHDMRADVPTVGVQTIERLHATGASALALGVGRVIMLDRPDVIATANRLGIAIVGVA
ncbi:MAG: UDP-2,3-diacylglucosamine diphosphatase LpxI [Phycisphaerales bacterium]|nr:UDP-2,3-diacylglucosamine diphosphatase LpxI [Phycisphaerales bacterium]